MVSVASTGVRLAREREWHIFFYIFFFLFQLQFTWAASGGSET